MLLALVHMHDHLQCLLNVEASSSVFSAGCISDVTAPAAWCIRLLEVWASLALSSLRLFSSFSPVWTYYRLAAPFQSSSSLEAYCSRWLSELQPSRSDMLPDEALVTINTCTSSLRHHEIYHSTVQKGREGDVDPLFSGRPSWGSDPQDI